MRKDTRSVCHLKNSHWEKIPSLSVTSPLKRYLICLSPQKLWGAAPRPLLQEFRFRDVAQPPDPPHLFFHAKKVWRQMEGWIKTKFRWKIRIQIRGRCTPRTPRTTSTPTSLFRSNRYGVLNKKTNLDSGVLHPIRKDIRSVCHLKMNYVQNTSFRWEVCER